MGGKGYDLLTHYFFITIIYLPLLHGFANLYLDGSLFRIVNWYHMSHLDNLIDLQTPVFPLNITLFSGIP